MFHRLLGCTAAVELPKQDSGTSQIQVSPNQVREQMGHPVHKVRTMTNLHRLYLRRGVSVDAGTEVIGDAVPVEEAPVPHHVLRLQPDLDHVQRGHEERH